MVDGVCVDVLLDQHGCARSTQWSNAWVSPGLHPTTSTPTTSTPPKRYRFATSLLFSACTALEYLTVVYPQHFLLLASVANVGKSVGLTTFIVTEPAFQKSFCRAENMADISAKTQAQQMVVDNVGLALALAVTHVAQRAAPSVQRRLPFVMFPLLAGGDLLCIYQVLCGGVVVLTMALCVGQCSPSSNCMHRPWYHPLASTQQLSSIQLRTLNKERSEIVAAAYVADDTVLTPADVCKRETLLLPPALTAGCMPLHMRPLEQVVTSPQELSALLCRYRGERYLLRVQGVDGRKRGRIDVCLREDAEVQDTMQAVLQVRWVMVQEGWRGRASTRTIP